MEKVLFLSGGGPELVCDRYRYSYFDSEVDGHMVIVLHWHEYYEAEFYVSGKAENIVNGVSHSVERGTLCLLKPGDFHKIIIDREAGACIRKLSFMPTVLPVRLRELFDALELPLILNFAGDGYDRLNASFDAFEAAAEEAERVNTPLSDLLRSNEAEKILLDIAAKAYGGNMAARERRGKKTGSDPVIRGIEYITSHITDKLTLSEIADQSYLCPSYYSRLFRRRTSMTLSEYITESRMRMAYYMLRDTDLTIEDVAARVGYRSKSLFYRSFQKTYDVPPGQVRARENKKTQTAK